MEGTLDIMKQRSRVTVFLVLFGLFTGNVSASNEAAFWKWFAANESRLFTSEANQEAIFDELAMEMHRVNNDLTFELGPVASGKREFVISAGGIRSAFPAVEALYNSAPKLERWVWVKYRPRRLPINDIEFGGRKVKVDDVRYLLVEDGDKVGIVLFIGGYSDDQRNIYGQIGYLFLDEALGEYAVETQVGFIEFTSQDSPCFSRACPLEELPAHFDEYCEEKSP